MLQDRLQEHIENGASLGRLIDRNHRKIYVYRPNQAPEVLDNLEAVDGNPQLPKSVLKMAKIW